MPSVKIQVGSKATIPLPPPYNVTFNPPTLVNITFSRTDVTLEAVGAGVGTMTLDSGSDWHLAVDVEIVAPQQQGQGQSRDRSSVRLAA